MRKFILGLIIGIGLIFLFLASISFTSFYQEKIAIINIRGEISSIPSFLTFGITPSSILPLIEKAEKDPSIKAVLFEINSPGGSVVASREVSLAIKSMKKPSVCWLGDIATSGAYWVASACDLIIADPLTLTGSIGVSASFLQFAGTLEKYGVTYERIVSGEAKDIGSPYRNLTEEEKAKLQKFVNETFEYFLNELIENRNLTSQQIENIITGDIFLAKNAIDLGLIDKLGSWQDAKELAKIVSGIEKPEFVELRKEFSLLDLLSGLI